MFPTLLIHLFIVIIAHLVIVAHLFIVAHQIVVALQFIVAGTLLSLPAVVAGSLCLLHVATLRRRRKIVVVAGCRHPLKVATALGGRCRQSVATLSPLL